MLVHLFELALIALLTWLIAADMMGPEDTAERTEIAQQAASAGMK